MFRLENLEEDFRNVLEKWLSVNDLVYHGSLVAFHKNKLDCRADDMPLNDMVLYHLLNIGSRDMEVVDKPWDTSMHSMWLEVGEGSCTSSGTGTKQVTDSVTGVWYEPSVGSDDGGVGDEASPL